jgi:hypothetical protein
MKTSTYVTKELSYALALSPLPTVAWAQGFALWPSATLLSHVFLHCANAGCIGCFSSTAPDTFDG